MTSPPLFSAIILSHRKVLKKAAFSPAWSSAWETESFGTDLCRDPRRSGLFPHLLFPLLLLLQEG